MVILKITSIFRVFKENTNLPYITVSHPYPISEFIEYSNNKMHVIGDGKLIFTANSGYGLPSSFSILVETPKSYH
jgi:hypothetical protein